MHIFIFAYSPRNNSSVTADRHLYIFMSYWSIFVCSFVPTYAIYSWMSGRSGRVTFISVVLWFCISQLPTCLAYHMQWYRCPGGVRFECQCVVRSSKQWWYYLCVCVFYSWSSKLYLVKCNLVHSLQHTKCDGNMFCYSRVSRKKYYNIVRVCI